MLTVRGHLLAGYLACSSVLAVSIRSQIHGPLFGLPNEHMHITAPLLTTYAVGDPAVMPLGSNVGVKDYAAIYAPSILTLNGCQPTTAYDILGEVKWDINIKDRDKLDTDLCQSHALAQMYARRRLFVLRSELRLAVVYAWRVFAKPTATTDGFFQWQHIVVFANLQRGGVPAIDGTFLYAPHTGLTSAYKHKPKSFGPYIVQAKNPNSPHEETLISALSADRGYLRRYPIIDVDLPGFPPRAKQALDEPTEANDVSCPLSVDNIYKTLEIAAAGTLVEFTH